MSKLIGFIKWIRKALSSRPPEIPTIIHVPRAMHEMEWNVHFPPSNPNRLGSRPVLRHNDVILVVVKNAQGATDHSGLKELLQKETGEDVHRYVTPTTDEWDPRYFCDDSLYTLVLLPASDPTPFHSLAIRDVYGFSLFFSYDASSTESWDEMVASCQDISSRCENGVIPFPTVVVAMGEGCVSREEAERFARQRSYRFFQYSSVTGHGLCKAFASIAEHTHGTRLRYATDPDGFQATLKATTEVLQRLFG